MYCFCELWFIGNTYTNVIHTAFRFQDKWWLQGINTKFMKSNEFFLGKWFWNNIADLWKKAFRIISETAKMDCDREETIMSRVGTPNPSAVFFCWNGILVRNLMNFSVCFNISDKKYLVIFRIVPNTMNYFGHLVRIKHWLTT